MRRVLTIAGSDSGGGAGIQADIKTVSALGAYAISAITALTAQNTCRVSGIHPVPVSFVCEQIEAVLDDIGTDSIKTGMLYRAETISAIAETLRRHPPVPVVVDPVMVATSGDSLVSTGAVDALVGDLFPLCTIVTPNIHEAALLSGIPVDSISDMQKAARAIREMGPRNVLITGGHLKQTATDVLFDGSGFKEYTAPKFETRTSHGTGCIYAAAIAAELAKGAGVPDAVGRAKEFVTTAVRFGLPLGSGSGPANPLAAADRKAQLYECRVALEAAFEKLQNASVGRLIPEVQSNLGYALPAAERFEDVLAFPGRIIRYGHSIRTFAAPQPAASQHVAQIILTAFARDARYRSAMNIVWSPSILDRCRKASLQTAEFDRRREPATIKQQEGSTLAWGVEKVIAERGSVPDIICDRGDTGKEPMTRVLGTDPFDVADKVITISRTETD